MCEFVIFEFTFVSLLSTDAESTVLRLTSEKQTWTFENISENPIISVNRNFTSPIIVNVEEQNDSNLKILVESETDPVAKYSAMKKLHLNTVEKLYSWMKSGLYFAFL